MLGCAKGLWCPALRCAFETLWAFSVLSMLALKLRLPCESPNL